ncbi:ferric reduction oxidase 7, chloroplastic-like [Mercurialis annua]|uniref:ferric reduction oxidase 7, chloroplastic-like n=1 Tax=Mercurialis annua TaxID=3986 RepID=UPI002160332A|nr:ferric reduction oxidase 7, chloroplastic-like [Mercurialis annua]
MDRDQIEPLLTTYSGVKKYNKSLLVTSVKWVLKIVMWAIFISWLCFIFFYPTKFVNGYVEKWNHATSGYLYGLAGSIFMLSSTPILLIAVLAIAYLIISSGEEEEFEQHHKKKNPRIRLWTFPVLVDGPFGVVSAAEFIGIVLFIVYIVWVLYVYTSQNLSVVFALHLSLKDASIWMLEETGLQLGFIGIFLLGFLFLPIARGSVLLRLIDIPFEHATRYHVWLGHLTMLVFTVHGLVFVIAWLMRGDLLNKILEWEDVGFSNLAGAIALLAGLCMWVTAFPGVRTWNFELFYYTHQLYVVFIVFLALHVSDFVVSKAAAGIFLYMLDRFLRFCQSRRTVDVISAKSYPCGTVQLVLSKPGILRYNALSFVFLQIREVSWLQWHPFSVASSPLEGKHHLSVLIKSIGEWTENLKKNVVDISEAVAELQDQPSQPHPKITASVEGPYGHEVPYHLMYENLILVAGGIGISAFVAILSDVLHRVNKGRPCLPKKILVIWAVKRSDELCLLSTADMESICPDFSEKLNLEIHIYVTRETDRQLEEEGVVSPCKLISSEKDGKMSVLVGTGDCIWYGVYVIVSTVGFLITLGLVDVYYVNKYGIEAWWYKGLIFLVCMAASVIIFGGCVVGLWERNSLGMEENNKHGREDENVVRNNVFVKNDIITHYGSRPQFKEIFSRPWGHVDVGVIVCGPPGLEGSVAKEIRSQNLSREANDPVFHFHSHSFDL